MGKIEDRLPEAQTISGQVGSPASTMNHADHRRLDSVMTSVTDSSCTSTRRMPKRRHDSLIDIDRYRIIAATSRFRLSTSCWDTTVKAGDESVRSANAIAPPWLQNTCSTSFTRTVTMMFPVAPRNRTRYWYRATGWLPTCRNLRDHLRSRSVCPVGILEHQKGGSAVEHLLSDRQSPADQSSRR